MLLTYKLYLVKRVFLREHWSRTKKAGVDLPAFVFLKWFARSYSIVEQTQAADFLTPLVPKHFDGMAAFDTFPEPGKISVLVDHLPAYWTSIPFHSSMPSHFARSWYTYMSRVNNVACSWSTRLGQIGSKSR